MLAPTLQELTALRPLASRKGFGKPRLSAAAGGGESRSPFRGQGLEFEETRLYAPGDDIRAIDWRVTARTGAPHTKLFREERDRAVLVMIDTHAYMRFGTKGTFKSVQAARIAALLGWRALHARDAAGACLFGGVPEGVRYIPPRRSSAAFTAALKDVCDISAGEESDTQIVPVDEALRRIAPRVPHGAALFILSDFSAPGEYIARELRMLRRRCDPVLIAVDDPADAMPSFPPDAVFAGAGGARVRITGKHRKAARAYKAQWQQTRDTVKEAAAGAGAPFFALSGEDDAAGAAARIGVRLLA